MTIYDMPQRSEAWHLIRKGKLTASAVGEWIAEQPECRLTIPELQELATNHQIEFKKSARRDVILDLLMSHDIELPRSMTKGAMDARETAINACLGDLAKLAGPEPYELDPDGPAPSSPQLWAIWNGLRLEDQARETLERQTGEEYEQVGFCEHPSKLVGCSPDGLTKNRKRGCEIKCPIASTHVRYLREDKLPGTYRPQVHFSLAVTGAESWDFWSYCPGLPPFHILVERDEYTERVERGIDEFVQALQQAGKSIHQLITAKTP